MNEIVQETPNSTDEIPAFLKRVDEAKTEIVQTAEDVGQEIISKDEEAAQ